MKLCKDCKHYRKVNDVAHCYKHVYIEVDPIDGTKTEAGEKYCTNQRHRSLSLFERATNILIGEGGKDYCGPKGKYYEAVC